MLEWGNKEVINTKFQPKGPRERAIAKNMEESFFISTLRASLFKSGLAQPLGKLGNCPRPQGKGGPKTLEKTGAGGKKKKKVSDESKKNLEHSFDQKIKFLLYTYTQLYIDSTTKFFGLNRINCSK